MPDKIFGLTRILDFIDRGHSFPSLFLPLAAVGSLPFDYSFASAQDDSEEGAQDDRKIPTGDI